ncbi:hypothetical protein QNM97_10505 [Gordonia sp. L191]|uniref:hypothetical protein n=1 Tax=Gordonia sp. L191 TaxID=2982699 RepID=UPI0024BF75A1|nr:hypothetical protein [Gordonia sp. L191]WHU49363.1 hypothetical protein QNM97_10505 [Gordonia sp. L191]
MASGYRSSADWTAVARVIAEATDRGIGAARTHELEELRDAVEELAIHADAARDVHGHLVRELLETSYQDGLDGDDVAEVLNRTVSATGRWHAEVDPTAVAVVLTGALGVAERPDDGTTSAPTPSDVVVAALLVAADLASATAVDHGPYVTRAVEELRRAQTVEIP